MGHEALILPIREWLIDQALGNPDIVTLFETLCLRISAVGIPVTRARLVWPTLHPLFQAETVIWDKGQRAYLEQFEHQDKVSDAWTQSPMKYVVDNDLSILRRELTGSNSLYDFPMLEDLHESGYTDYVVLGTSLEGTAFRVREGENDRGVLVTWATDAVTRFSDDDLIALQTLQKRFAVACKVLIQSRIASNISRTYLGDRAGSSVLNGKIRRGDGQKTNAVIVYSDLRDSTQLAEQMKADDYFSLLNSYFSATAQPIIDNGGEILDFIGDAVLGIFPYNNKRELNAAARAADNSIRAMFLMAKEVNHARQVHNYVPFNFGVGINIGEVKFGNIGIPSRLAFSVIGPAVNEASRIEALSKKLKRKILAGKSFAQLAPENWQSLGKHRLRGVGEEIEIFEYSKSL